MPSHIPIPYYYHAFLSVPINSQDNKSDCCTVIYVNGVPYWTITDGAITVSVGMPQIYDKHYFAQMVFISNSGDTPIEVNPATITATGTDSSLLASVNGDAVIEKKHRSAIHRNMWASALAGAGAGVSQNTATVQNSDGTSSTVTYHDPQADADARNAAASRRDSIDAKYQASAGTILRRNTLFKGGSAGGLVLFERPKSMDKRGSLATTTIIAGNTTFYF